MRNYRLLHGIICPYCSSMTLKLLPIDNTFKEYHETSAFCSECGRHAIGIVKPEKSVA